MQKNAIHHDMSIKQEKQFSALPKQLNKTVKLLHKPSWKIQVILKTVTFI